MKGPWQWHLYPSWIREPKVGKHKQPPKIKGPNSALKEALEKTTRKSLSKGKKEEDVTI